MVRAGLLRGALGNTVAPVQLRRRVLLWPHATGPMSRPPAIAVRRRPFSTLTAAPVGAVLVDAPVRSAAAGEVWLGGMAGGSTCSVAACGKDPGRLTTSLFATEAERTTGAAGMENPTAEPAIQASAPAWRRLYSPSRQTWPQGCLVRSLRIPPPEPLSDPPADRLPRHSRAPGRIAARQPASAPCQTAAAGSSGAVAMQRASGAQRESRLASKSLLDSADQQAACH